MRTVPNSFPESSDDSVRTEETVDVEPSRPVVQPEKGVVENNKIPDDQCRIPEGMAKSDSPPRKEVRFKENPMVILPSRDVRVDEYDILQDIKDQKANVTIGQLLHDNVNYQKQLKEALVRPRKRRIRLPPVAVNFAQVEDYGAPEITVEIEGCVIHNVPVDGGSGVNLILESTAFDLGYATFDPTNQVLRMADQSRVVPVGRLSGIPTRISNTTYLLNYVVIRVGIGKPFPLLLGRPWLYSAGVKVN